MGEKGRGGLRRGGVVGVFPPQILRQAFAEEIEKVIQIYPGEMDFRPQMATKST
jgi:hypothetical protein